MVDEDRDWLHQLDAFVGILRGVGAVVGLALLGAAVITIGSVIRLTAYLYRDEIAVMRLVGATEMYIRGPILLRRADSRLLGGLVAVLGLYAAFLGTQPQGNHRSSRNGSCGPISAVAERFWPSSVSPPSPVASAPSFRRGLPPRRPGIRLRTTRQIRIWPQIEDGDMETRKRGGWRAPS